MNDIEKLHNVIETLEKQSNSVTEFNGILSAVNQAKGEINSANKELNEYTDLQKKSLAESKYSFKLITTKVDKLESQVALLEEKLLKKIESLDFVTPENHAKCLASTEGSINKELKTILEQNNLAVKQRKSEFKYLTIILSFSFLILSTGIGFLLKNLFT